MKKGILATVFALVAWAAHGQSHKKIEAPDGRFEPYFVVEPKGEIRGAMVLLPGGSQEPESIFPETKLHNVAYLHNILVIAMSYGKTTIYLTDEVLGRMDAVLADAMVRYGIPRDKFVIGGYSAGGTTALSYTVHCKQHTETALIDPQAVFTADSPVDVAVVWYTLQRELKKNHSEAAMAEAQYFLPQIEKDMEGTPENNMDNYIRHSPFSLFAEDGGNAKYLIHTPVRVHHDADIVWQIENRRRSFYDMNEPQASAMINYLRLNGNDRAEFVLADRPALRSSGSRHPHSWSVIEEVGCILWVKECLDIR